MIKKELRQEIKALKSKAKRLEDSSKASKTLKKLNKKIGNTTGKLIISSAFLAELRLKSLDYKKAKQYNNLDNKRYDLHFLSLLSGVKIKPQEFSLWQTPKNIITNPYKKIRDTLNSYLLLYLFIITSYIIILLVIRSNTIISKLSFSLFLLFNLNYFFNHLNQRLRQ